MYYNYNITTTTENVMDYQVDVNGLENAEAAEELAKENGTFDKGEGNQEVPTDEEGNEIEVPF